MNANDIISLVNAGFTKEEIMKMFGPEPEQKEPEQKEPEQKEPEQKELENNSYYAELIKKLDNLADTIKTSNFRTPMPFKPVDTETKVDNFFANIINPELNEERSKKNG